MQVSPDQTTTDRKIWRAVASIPAGKVASYGQVARLAGLGRAARRVAPALRRAPAELQLPWHRLLRATGEPGLSPGSAGRRRQLQLLEKEGVPHANERVDMRLYQWQQNRAPDLDKLLWQMD